MDYSSGTSLCECLLAVAVMVPGRCCDRAPLSTNLNYQKLIVGAFYDFISLVCFAFCLIEPFTTIYGPVKKLSILIAPFCLKILSQYICSIYKRTHPSTCSYYLLKRYKGCSYYLCPISCQPTFFYFLK